MRYLIKFTKEGNIKFISHLDLMRSIERVILRSGLDVEYSKGFHPHMALSIAQPLSVGVSSVGEYMDIVLKEPVDEMEIIDKLNKNSLMGVRFLEIRSIESLPNVKKVPQAMAMVEEATYTIKIKYTCIEDVESELKTLLEKSEWIITKKNKKGEEKSVNIRPMIRDIKYWIKNEYLVLNTRVSCGSKEHLNTEFLINYIKENTIGINEEAFVDINREEMYAAKDGKLLPLYKIV